MFTLLRVYVYCTYNVPHEILVAEGAKFEVTVGVGVGRAGPAQRY